MILMENKTGNCYKKIKMIVFDHFCDLFEKMILDPFKNLIQNKGWQ